MSPPSELRGRLLGGGAGPSVRGLRAWRQAGERGHLPTLLPHRPARAGGAAGPGEQAQASSSDRG